MNVRLLLEYDGTEFSGWQRQPHKPTIQAAIEDVLAYVTGHRTVVIGAGRTDSGVHACAYPANFHTDYPAPASKWRDILNNNLPKSVRVLEAREAPIGFCAQRNIVTKVYEYRLLNTDVASAFDRRVWFFPPKLDWNVVKSSLPYFVGTKDFGSFCCVGSSAKTSVRTITCFELYEAGGGLFFFRVEGSGFLKQMVRTMVGTVVEVGLGQRSIDTLPGLFINPDRRRAGRTAPACGLFFLRARYS